MIRRNVLVLATGSIVAGAVIATEVQAQNEAATDKSPRAALEEVTVTAQKRDEKAQDVPLSLTVLSSDSLSKIGFTNFKDIAEKVPSLNLAPMFLSTASLKLYMRGVGQENPLQLSRDNGVGVYLDDVYVGHAMGLSSELGDTERIEVLPGPQGTLYGRNTIGGAVKFISAKPTGVWGFKQSLDMGNFGYYNVVTNLNLPQVAGISTKLTLMKSDLDGWVENSGAAGNFGRKNALGYRVALRWEPIDALTVDYAFDHARNDGTPGYQQRQYYSPLFPFNFPLFHDRQDRSWRPVDTPTKDDFDGNNHALTANWRLTDELAVKSITAYRELTFGYLADSLESFNLPVFQGSDQIAHQFSQEFLLTGATDDSRFKYHLGLFYFRESGDEHNTTIVDNFALATAVPFVPASVADLVPAQSFRTQNESSAVYGQVTWTPPILSDALSIDVGGRYSRDKRAVQQHLPFNVPPLPVDAAGEVSYTSFDPSVTVDYKWTQSVHAYAKVAKAYRAGGFDPTANVIPIPYNPEHLTSYETGLKSQWLDHRLLVNVDAFFGKYKDIQINFYNPKLAGVLVGSTQTVNGAAATIKGWEGELKFIPVDGLSLNSSVTYLTFDSTRTNPFTHETTSGQLPSTPRWKYNASAEYTFLPLSFGTVSALLSYDYHGKELPAGGITASDYRPGYGLVDGRVTVSDIRVGGGDMAIGAWVRNLTDREYQVYHNSGSVIFGMPRSYGLNISFKY